MQDLGRGLHWSPLKHRAIVQVRLVTLSVAVDHWLHLGTTIRFKWQPHVQLTNFFLIFYSNRVDTFLLLHIVSILVCKLNFLFIFFSIEICEWIIIVFLLPDGLFDLESMTCEQNPMVNIKMSMWKIFINMSTTIKWIWKMILQS